MTYVVTATVIFAGIIAGSIWALWRTVDRPARDHAALDDEYPE